MNEKKSTLVVNLFGGPGAGKSTGAAYLFYLLKQAKVNAELVTEFAKDKVYEESKEVFNNQAYIFGKQYFRMSRLLNKVDVIVTDSPLLLSIYYNSNPALTNNFNNTVMDVHNSFTNMNFFITRDKPYNPSGRFQTEEESNSVSDEILEMIKFYNLPFVKFNGNEENYNKIFQGILNELNDN